MSLPKPTIGTVFATVDAMAQDQARRNVEDAIEKKDVINLAEVLAASYEGAAAGVKKEVNGQIATLRAENNEGMRVIRVEIADHNIKHEADMQRILPMLTAFESSQRFAQDAKTSGVVMTKIAAFIVAMGAAYLMLKQVFF